MLVTSDIESTSFRCRRTFLSHRAACGLWHVACRRRLRLGVGAAAGAHHDAAGSWTPVHGAGGAPVRAPQEDVGGLRPGRVRMSPCGVVEVLVRNDWSKRCRNDIQVAKMSISAPLFRLFRQICGADIISHWAGQYNDFNINVQYF